MADLKAEIQAKSEVEKERQRLIYSGELIYGPSYSNRSRADRTGKVLKDEDEISNYKIQVSQGPLDPGLN